MANYFVQVALEHQSGIPEDSAVNTWSFQSNSGSPTPGEVTAITNGLATFYSLLETYYSELLTGDASIKVYNLADPEPRTPIEAGEASIFSPDGSPLPEEVAVCMSFSGALVSGQPPARRRGRIYLGPLSTDTVLNAGGTAVRVAGAFVDQIRDAQSALFDILDPAGVLHTVWSRSDDELYDVVKYWVDNSFDTQRRRGREPTIKTQWAWDAGPTP